MWTLGTTSNILTRMRSLTFTKFMLMLCGIYFGMVLYIHYNIQSRPSAENVVEYVPQHDRVQDENLSKWKQWVRNQKLYQQLKKDVRELEEQVESAKLQINKLKGNHISDKCLQYGYENVKYNSFLKVDNGIYVYSAYLDDRKPEIFVRLMMLIERSRKKTPIYCHIDSLTILAKQYEMCENHNKAFGGYIYSCALPTNSSLACPLSVSINPKSTSNVSLPIIITHPVQRPKEFGICISPLFGSVTSEKLVEFIELSRILGAEQFYFYDNNISNRMKSVLEYYQQKNLVTLLPWRLPSVVGEKNIWYHGQLIAHNDCLYRTMSTIKHVVFNDIDEFIIPHNTKLKYWTEFLPEEFGDKYCGIAFPSAFFDPAMSKTHTSGLFTLGSTSRTNLFSYIRTKIMVQPWRVFEIGIHHVSKQNEEKWSVLKYKADKAYLHHYRKCIGNYGMKCNQYKEDKEMFKYSSELQIQFDKTMTDLRYNMSKTS